MRGGLHSSMPVHQSFPSSVFHIPFTHQQEQTVLIRFSLCFLQPCLSPTASQSVSHVLAASLTLQPQTEFNIDIAFHALIIMSMPASCLNLEVDIFIAWAWDKQVAYLGFIPFSFIPGCSVYN